MTNDRPVIGITPCSAIRDYVESVKRAGGDPIVLHNSDNPADVLARVDGVLLTGGADVDPALYGQDPHDRTEVDPNRDRFELPLARAALAGDTPLFAICRGVQVMNVAAGGTLVQDLPSQTSSELRHSIEVPKSHLAHTVQIEAGSRLAGAMGDAQITACSVNSRHHQAVATVAPAFVVSAVSPDGVIEAIERPSGAFCIGVQWHPENFWQTGEFDQLFHSFIDSALQRAQLAHSPEPEVSAPWHPGPESGR